MTSSTNPGHSYQSPHGKDRNEINQEKFDVEKLASLIEEEDLVAVAVAETPELAAIEYEGMRLVHLAILHHSEAARAMIDRPDIYRLETPQGGFPVLHMAARKDTTVAQWALDNLDVDEMASQLTSQDGTTVAHAAVKAGWEQATHVLEHPKMGKLEDHMGKTVFHVIAEHYPDQIFTILQQGKFPELSPLLTRAMADQEPEVLIQSLKKREITDHLLHNSLQPLLNHEHPDLRHLALRISRKYQQASKEASPEPGSSRTSPHSG